MSKPIEYGRPWWEVMKEVAAENARLKAENERLRKAGDAMERSIAFEYPDSPKIKDWNAAKEEKDL